MIIYNYQIITWNIWTELEEILVVFVCLYIRNDIKYKLRPDLCRANSNFESCFIEIENDKSRNNSASNSSNSSNPAGAHMGPT